MFLFSDEGDFKISKLIFESGGDWKFETWWSVDGVGFDAFFEVGKGENKGNALQLIFAMRKHKSSGRGNIKIEQFDSLLCFLFKKVKFVFLCFESLEIPALIKYLL